jgi:hypothetical protein
MADKDRKVIGFKKFSDLKGEESSNSSSPIDLNDDIPMNPNLPNKQTKIEKTMSIKGIKPELESPESTEVVESKVETYGKVAKFPKNVKASKAFNFLENVKVSRKSIWYIMVEKQDNELQMVKYNYKEGVNLSQFVNELKTYYIEKYSKDNNDICESIRNIQIGGNDKYSHITNIPLIQIDGKRLITRITEDLIKLLSK